MKRSVVSMSVILGVVAPLALGCDDGCFEERTLVRTPEGLAPIGELVVGDAVVSIDPSTGAEATTHVARVSYSWAWCEKLVIDGRSVWLTEEHPLYSPELSEFRLAESWLAGELQWTLSEGGNRVATTGGGWLDRRPCRVVDLTVDAEPHTFVAAGIVVHNKSLVCSPDDEDCTDCLRDEHCQEGYVCNTASRCVRADDGTGGSGGTGGASGQGGAGGQGGMGGATGGG